MMSYFSINIWGLCRVLLHLQLVGPFIDIVWRCHVEKAIYSKVWPRQPCLVLNTALNSNHDAIHWARSHSIGGMLLLKR